MVKRILFIAVLVVAGILILGSRQIAGVFTDILWFKSLGYLEVFLIPITWKIIIGLTTGFAVFIFLYINLIFAARSIGRSWYIATRFANISTDQIKRSIKRIFTLFALIASVLTGIAMSSEWITVQSFLNRTDSGVLDPLFNMDISFYLFTLPLYQTIYKLVILFAVTSFIGSLILYVFSGVVNLDSFRTGNWEGPAKTHLGILIALILFVKAWGYRLQGLSLVYSQSGVTFGGGFTDVHALLPGLRILTVLAMILAVLVIVSIFIRSRRLLITTFAVYILSSMVIGAIFPNLVQKFAVDPSELSRESPYIAYNIQSTRAAFGLDEVSVKSLDVNHDLTFEHLIKDHKDTIENIRLWDWRSLGQTYSQLQEIRAYYDFYDIDLDRYKVGDRIRQMAISARELSVDLVPQQAKTWVSQHLVYTHGYGLAMSPTNEVSKDGLPKFFISDIPPKSSYPGFEVTRPEIYFGEKPDDYVIVNTKLKEFDYPEGESNAYTTYQGKGGVELSSMLRKIAFAIRFGNSKIFLSQDITGKSRILSDRNIKDRVRKIAPFLRYDDDPYLVLVDGRLVWIWDAYTTSNLYPYSQPVQEGFNYIRNSVKIVIDAYDGDVTFYLFDPQEPIAKTLSKIFKGMFKPFDDMSDSLKAHVRYPQDLFHIQARMLCLYHMTDPDTFYNKGDTWDFPIEIYGDSRVGVTPYYVIMKTPGEEEAEYILILPFVPSGKDNMIGWLMARCDVPHLGELVLYTFPKDRLVYGPMQIESKIDQHPEISQALTLWGQHGSKVVRGNLLVIPIEESLLYVEPLYLLAEQSELPELRRVLVAFGDSVAMGDTMEDALKAVFAKTDADIQEPSGKGIVDEIQPLLDEFSDKIQDPDVPETVKSLVEDAIKAYQEADKHLTKGDFAGFGESLSKLGEILEQLKERME